MLVIFKGNYVKKKPKKTWVLIKTILVFTCKHKNVLPKYALAL